MKDKDQKSLEALYESVDNPSEGPVTTEQDDGSTVTTYKDRYGKYHRLDGPAYVRIAPNGVIQYEAWWLNGKRHRLDGPAWMSREFLDGSVMEQEYWIEGVKIPMEEFLKIALKKRLKGQEPDEARDTMVDMFV